MLPPKKCLACGILFTPKQNSRKFCDRRCKDRAQGRFRLVKCAGCGKLIKRVKSALLYESSVCNRACQTRAKFIPWATVDYLRHRGYSFRSIGLALGCEKTKVRRIYTPQPSAPHT